MKEPQPKRIYIKRHSGYPYNLQLDDHTLNCLERTYKEHISRGKSISKNIIVRRAIRLYKDFLIYQCPDYELEVQESMRAAKGVL